MRRRKLVGGFSIGALIATLLVLGASSVVSPAGAWVGPSSNTNAAVPMDCVATAPVVGEVPASQDIALTTSAPNKVEAGEQFDIFSQPDASTAPSNVSGFTINSIRQFEVRIPLPAGATRVNEQIVPGTGTGFGSSNIVWDAGNSRWVFTVSGPIAGGANFQFPQLRIRVQATGAPGATIQPRLGGNSKTNYGFSLIVNANLPSPIGTSDIPTACWPKQPNPAFSTTQIIPIDNAAPTVTIASPSDFGTYGLGLNVPANYSCNDGTNGSGVATCNGTVANGAPIDTSSLGTKSFTVNTTDAKGNAGSKTVTYEVVDLPGISVQPTWANEGSPAVFTVNLSKAWTVPVSVNYATVAGSAVAGTDYTHTAGLLTFTPGQFSKTVSVPTADDAIYQGELDFTLQLSNPVSGLLATSSAGARILDGETPAPEAVGKTVTEGPGVTVDFDVSIPFDPGVPVNVSYQTVDGFAIVGNDYQIASGNLTFNPGDPLTQTVSVPVIDDAEDDGYAIDFSLEVTNVATGEVGTSGQAVIIDNDGPPPVAVNVGANIGDVRLVEGDDSGRTAWLTVRLDQPAPADFAFNYTTVDGSATAASKDFKAEAKSLIFKTGQTARTISLTVTPDTIVEGDEEFYVDLTFVGGGTPIGDSRGTVVIEDDDSPTASDYVVSIGDAVTYEGNSALGVVDLPLTINKKRAKDAPDEDIPVRVDVVYDSANATDVQVNNLGWTVTFPGGVNKNVQLKVRGDGAVEGNEQLTVVVTPLPATPGSVTIGRAVGTLTILDDDGVPGAPVAPSAKTSETKLGGVDFTWGAPLGGQAPTGYEWRVATDGTLDTEPWTSTDTGLNRHIEHDCGQGNTCEYQVRAVNSVGTGPASGIVSAVGLEDNIAPDLLVFAPQAGGNTDSYTGVTYNGLIGTEFGDAKSVDVNVYPCANCTNVAPIDSPAATVGGAGWSATGATLAPGVYTAQVLQTDWVGNTAETIRTFETRNAVFVSATGNNANPGTAALPKQTIANGLATAVTDGRPEVAVGQGTYGALSVTAGQGNTTINGGYDQYTGWARPGTAGAGGTPNQDLTNIEAGPTAVLVTGATGLTINGLRIKGSNAGQPAGSSIYGLRAVSGANVALQNVKVIADSGVDGTNGANGANGANGNGGTEGPIGGEPCTGTHNGGPGGTGANNGGRGGNAPCNNTGGAGVAGSGASGGAAGGGGARANPIFGCDNGGSGGAGLGGGGGAASGTLGAAGTGGTAGATWAGNNGSAGGAGTAGSGGGGGGAGGGTNNPLSLCSGNDWGGAGGGGGAGAAGGGGGGLGTAGGGSFGVYAQNSTVTADALTTITAGSGGKGGNGGNAGAGGSGGAGGRGGSVTNSGNGGAPVGNASPFPCGLFFPACYADGGPGAGGGGGGAGAGGNGGGGGAGGPSAAVLHTGTGTVTIGASTLAGAGGAGGAGGTAGAHGLRGELGAAAAGAWTSTANQGTQGGVSGGVPAAGGTGGTGFACRIHVGGVCTLP